MTASRKFYDFGESNIKQSDDYINKNITDLVEFIKDNIIGSNYIFTSPFGFERKVTYCDYIASGRSLKFLEDYIVNEVLPTYGSTHTTTSVTSLQTTLFRHEARDIIRNAVRASEHDRIIFGGSGTTGVINKLVHCLNFSYPPIVFIDSYAHHSSSLPWRHIAAKVIRIKETAEGLIDLNHLEDELKKHQNEKNPLIGFFTAASNITGIVVDDVEITILLHRYKAFAFWDYATAAPYVDIVMNPILENDPTGLSHKDAVFFSFHKFLGGVQTPGVMVAKKFLFKSEIPSETGGGTVFFVTPTSHRYLKNVEEREEGGTPSIVETIRAGLVMQLKMNITPQFIMEKSKSLSRCIAELAEEVEELVAIGNMNLENRLPILSFMVKSPVNGRYLHHNFVSSLLNDLFGIQSRGGCACAGPYALDLLGINEELANEIENSLLENPSLDRSHLRRKEEHSCVEVLRPGFTRLNLPFTSSDEEVNYILEALRIVSKHGWKFLPQYIMNPETGEWKHHTNLVFKQRQWLQNISYTNGKFCPNLKPVPKLAPDFNRCLIEVNQAIEHSVKVTQRMTCPDQTVLFAGYSHLRWFLLPCEAKNALLNSNTSSVSPIPYLFTPATYPLTEIILSNRANFVIENIQNIKMSNYIPVKSISNGENITNGIIDTKINDKKIVSENDTQNYGLTCRPKLKEAPTIPLNCVVRWVPPTKNIFNATVSAIQEFDMIRDGDKLMVCLSGGKDSLSLLHTLKQYQYYAKSKKINFDIGAVTVDPQSSSYDPRPLIPYLAALKVPYAYEQQEILKQAMELPELNSICSFCSRMKRGRIYSAARRWGYNVLAFGQHLDDMSESFLMSVFHNGRLRTMKASYQVQEEDLRVIRPFVYVREKSLRNFAESNKLPVIPENCPACFEAPKERHRMKQLLAQQEVIFPKLFWSLKTAILPLLSISKTGMENVLYGKNCVKREQDSDSN